MMHSRGLVILLLFLPGGARRSIRIDESHHGAQQQNNALANGLESSAESQETLIPGGSSMSVFRRAGPRAGSFRFGPRRAKVALEVKCQRRAITPTERMRMRGVSGREATLVDKVRNIALAGVVTAGLFSTPVAANAVDVKLGSDSGQLVFVPDEVTIKAGESVTWIGNKGLPHNVVFDEDNVPEGTNLDAINHEEQLGEEGQKVTSKFEKPGTYGYYCEPHRGAGMNGVVIVK